MPARPRRRSGPRPRRGAGRRGAPGPAAGLGRVVADEGRLQQRVLDELLDSSSTTSPGPQPGCERDVVRRGVARAASSTRCRGRPARRRPRDTASWTGSRATAAEVDLAALAVGDRGARRSPRAASSTSSRASSADGVVVAVGLVGLEHRELGAVGGVDALVAEGPADLVDLVHAADDGRLRYSSVAMRRLISHVERVEVGAEGPGRGAAVDELQDRRLDLEVARRVEGLAQRRGARSPWCGPSRAPPGARPGRRSGAGRGCPRSSSLCRVGSGRSALDAITHASP